MSRFSQFHRSRAAAASLAGAVTLLTFAAPGPAGAASTSQISITPDAVVVGGDLNIDGHCEFEPKATIRTARVVLRGPDGTRDEVPMYSIDAAGNFLEIARPSSPALGWWSTELQCLSTFEKGGRTWTVEAAVPGPPFVVTPDPATP
jgi:hypothetical protein